MWGAELLPLPFLCCLLFCQSQQQQQQQIISEEHKRCPESRVSACLPFKVCDEGLLCTAEGGRKDAGCCSRASVGSSQRGVKLLEHVVVKGYHRLWPVLLTLTRDEVMAFLKLFSEKPFFVLLYFFTPTFAFPKLFCWGLFFFKGVVIKVSLFWWLGVERQFFFHFIF